jgi:hypothetical protein
MFSTASFITLFANTVILTETSTSTASPDFHQTTKTRTTHATAGTSTDPALPYQISEVVTLRFLPPVTTTALEAVDGYVLDPATVTGLKNGVNAAFAAFGSTIQLQILHRRGSLNGAVTPFSLSPVSSGDISNKPVIQKRRGDKLTPVRTAIAV